MCSLALFFYIYNYCSINFMCVSFYYKFYVFFYYKFILIKEFIKHNQKNYLCCDIRYIDLYFSLSFLNLIFVYCWWFFFHYFTQRLLGCLIKCVHKFFDLHLRVFFSIYVCARARAKFGGGNYLANAYPIKFKGFKCY